MSQQFVDLTEAEWAIMKAVWDAQPCAAPTVQEALQESRNWSYSTVRTLMDRMVGKGLLKAEKIRNLTLFRAAITIDQAQRGGGSIRFAQCFRWRAGSHDAMPARQQ